MLRGTAWWSICFSTPSWPTRSWPLTATVEADGIDDWMVTVDEYDKILQSVYDRGYVLVDIR